MHCSIGETDEKSAREKKIVNESRAKESMRAEQKGQ
jgi:hypothetical protein